MRFKKTFFLSLFLFLFFIFIFTSKLNAQNLTPAESRKSQTSAFMSTSGIESSREAENIFASIIKIALSLLGIVFVILIIFSGYQWMTAGGNEEQVKKAQSRIKNAVIGVIIVVLAYSITAFIFKNLPGGSGSGSAGTTSGGACSPPCASDKTCVGGVCQ